MHEQTKLKVLLTGASGFLGSRVLAALTQDADVELLQRRKTQVIEKQHLVEFSESSDFSKALEGKDCVVHCAARAHIMQDNASNPLSEFRKINTLATVKLAKQAAQAGVKRFIFISSIKVNGESTSSKPFTESDPRQPIDDYGISKSEAEIALLNLAKSSEIEIVIIRPPLVYGPGVKANFASLMNLVNKGVPLPFGMLGKNRRSMVYVDNLVELIRECSVNPAAANQIFLISDNHDLSTKEMVVNIANGLGKKSLMLPIPEFIYRFLGKITGKSDVIDRLLGSLQVDPQSTFERLNWTPPYALETGFQETAKEFLKRQQNDKGM